MPLRPGEVEPAYRKVQPATGLCEICGQETVKDSRGRFRRTCGPEHYRQLRSLQEQDALARHAANGAIIVDPVEVPNPKDLAETNPDEVFQLGLRSLVWFLTDTSIPVQMRLSATMSALRVPGVKRVLADDDTTDKVRKIFEESAEDERPLSAAG